jgi:hypothetical protein
MFNRTKLVVNPSTPSDGISQVPLHVGHWIEFNFSLVLGVVEEL